MPTESILIVDDDEFFGRVLSYRLRAKKYRCGHVRSTEEALERLSQDTKPSLILLDYFLGPQTTNGLRLCVKIKALTDIPIIMLTANNDIRTIVCCLDAGADQYVVKPYNLEELTARIRVVLRQQPSSSTITGSQAAWMEVELDSVGRLIRVGEREVTLSEKEVEIMEALISHGGQIVEREALYRIIYERDFDSLSRAIDVLVGRVRRKLASITTQYTIRSIRGIGYILQSSKASRQIKS